MAQMGKAELSLREPRRLLVLSELTRDLSSFVRESETAGEASQFVLVTYNRVGEGLLEARTIEGGRTLDTYSGRLMLTVQVEQWLTPDDGYSPLLSLEQVGEFYGLVGDELARQILLLDKPAFFFVYGGEGEKFKIALKLIDKLSFAARAVGKQSLAKFYLLTCNCGLAGKAKMVEDLHSQGRLKSVVYNPAGACGGQSDMQAVAEAILR